MLLRLWSRDGAIDAAVAAARSVRLIAAGDALYADVASVRAPAFVRALAYAGIAADPVTDVPEPDRSAVPAIAERLDPLPPGIGALDVLWVEAVPLAVATRRSLGPRIVRWLRGDARRSRCRELLRGNEQLLAWERRAWISRAAIGDPRVRRVIRPIVFERVAMEPLQRSHLCRRESGEISRWLAG